SSGQNRSDSSARFCRASSIPGPGSFEHNRLRFLPAQRLSSVAFSNEGKNGVTTSSEQACVEVRGARQNNLKGFDLDLPLGKLTAVDGPGGSEKSSLAFDPIYAEGQGRYVETFSP